MQHILTNLSGGQYDLEVVNRTANQGDTYALAWHPPVPEPASLSLLAVGVGWALLAHFRRRQR